MSLLTPEQQSESRQALAKVRELAMLAAKETELDPTWLKMSEVICRDIERFLADDAAKRERTEKRE